MESALSVGLVSKKLFVTIVYMVIAFAQPLMAMGRANMDIKTVGLSCEGGLAIQSCEGFVAAMATKYPQYTFVHPASNDTDMTVTLSMSKLSERSFKGQMSWSGAKSGAGPELSSNVLDSNIRQSMLDRHVKAIIEQSPVPF